MKNNFIHSRPQNRAIYGADGAWPLSIPPKEPRASAQVQVGSIKTLFFYILVFLAVFNLNIVSANDESDQKILGFTLSNFGEDNQKTWDLVGDKLEVFGNIIHLSNIKANLYGKQENMVLTADSGTFDRSEGKLHLQDNVVIVSDSGAKMMTDTLDWLQKNQVVQTEDKVNIYKNNIEAEGVGAVGKTDLKQVSLSKDVQVNINEDSQGKMKQTTITCDGPLNIDYQKQEAVFNDNVKAHDGESELYADKMTGYFDKDSKKIIKIIAEGNVKIVRGQDTSYSDKAIYDANNQKITLEGRPKLIFYSEGGMKGME